MNVPFNFIDKRYKHKTRATNKMNTFWICALLVLSVNALRPKFCYNCRHFLPAENDGEAIFGKCAAFPVVVENKDYLITGVKDSEIIDHRYCSSARTNDRMCGEEGKLHKRVYRKNTHKK